MQPVAYVPGLDALRRRRAELFESMAALEQALAALSRGGAEGIVAWRQWVDVALAELAADVRAHVAITEGPDGLHGDVMVVAPRLAHAVERLVAEHDTIGDLLGALTARARAVRTPEQAEGVRCLGATLLARLDRHRRRGAQLVFEAYQTDIGGET